MLVSVWRGDVQAPPAQPARKGRLSVLLRSTQHLDGDEWRVGSEDGLRLHAVTQGGCECADCLCHGSGHPPKHCPDPSLPPDALKKSLLEGEQLR